jgi:hypothetical protein
VLRVVAVALLAAACEDSGRGPTGPNPVGATYDVSIGPVTLSPGEERIVCVDKRLPSDHPIDVVQMTSDLTPGGHHIILYKSSATTENTTPFPCQSFRDILTGTVPLFIAQKPHTELEFPRGVAYRFPAGQMVRMELHFLNATQAPASIAGTVHLGEATAGTVTDHANLLFWGRVDIDIPAAQQATVGPSFHYFRQTDLHIFGVTGHQHHLGTGFKIELANAIDDTAAQTIYENNDWANPPLKSFDPPLSPKDGQGFRFTCSYDNTTSQTVKFGESVNDEMCFLWAYYYPDEGFDVFACPINFGQFATCNQ